MSFFWPSTLLPLNGRADFFLEVKGDTVGAREGGLAATTLAPNFLCCFLRSRERNVERGGATKNLLSLPFFF